MPTPQPAGQPGVIVETPEQIQALSNIFAAGDPDVPVMIAELERRRPNAPSAAIANCLITAHCPSARDARDAPNLSEAEKTTKLKAFTGRVLKFFY